MEEIVFWKEVDEKEYLNDINSFRFLKDDEEVWLKRVVVNILSDQEIEEKAKLITDEWYWWIIGYKAKQNELIGGERL